MIKDILKKLSLDSEKIIMIGDTWHNKEAASKMNIKFIDAKDIHDRRM